MDKDAGIGKVPNAEDDLFEPAPELTVAYLIREPFDHKRIAGPDCTQEQFFAFLAPLARGEPLTPELLAHKPDPYYIDPPERGGLPDMFDAKQVWTVSEKVKVIIEDLEPGIHTFIPVEPIERRSDAALELTFSSTSGK